MRGTPGEGVRGRSERGDRAAAGAPARRRGARGHRDDQQAGERGTESRRPARHAIVCDALDPEAVQAAVRESAPEVVISQLTRLPRDYNPRKIDYGPTNRARAEGGHNLIEAARAGRCPPLHHPERRLHLRAGGRHGQGRGGAALDRCARALRQRRRARRSSTSERRRRLPGSRASCCATASSTGRAPTTRPTATSPSRCAAAASRSWVAGTGCSRSSTSTTRPAATVARWSAGRPGSTTWSTTSPRRCANGCRCTRRRSAPGVPSESRRS